MKFHVLSNQEEYKILPENWFFFNQLYKEACKKFQVPSDAKKYLLEYNIKDSDYYCHNFIDEMIKTYKNLLPSLGLTKQ